METFQDWLRVQLESSGMSYREVARKGNISGPRISQVLSGENPGTDFCIGIARGLSLPPDLVLQKAGILPPQPAEVPEERHALDLFRRLETELRGAMILTMQNILGIRTVNNPTERQPEQPTSPTDKMVARLAQQLSTMTPEEQELVFDFMDKIQRFRGGKSRRNLESGSSSRGNKDTSASGASL